MSGVDPRTAGKLAALGDLSRSAQTIHGLTEQFAAARSNEDQFAQQLKRRYGHFKRSLMGAGFDQIAQLAGGMETAAGRSGSQRTKARILREGIASLRSQLELEERIVRASGEEEADDGGTTKTEPGG
jgi:hypothetical protein